MNKNIRIAKELVRIAKKLTASSDVYLLNAFSIQMISTPATVDFEDISRDEALELLSGEEIRSAVGHQDTANVLSNQLGKEVKFNRINVKLSKGDVAVVAQVTGGRLPEGTTVLPEGMNIKFVKITVK